MKRVRPLLPVLPLLVLVSCRTIDVNGMIYDFSNRPVSYCAVSLGVLFKSSTDINGRFTLPKVPVGVYTITGEKKGFETYTDELAVRQRGQIVYIRIPSQSQLLEMVDDALTNNDLTAAGQLLQRAYQIDQHNIEMLFYYATVKFRQREYDAAIHYLETAQNLGSKDLYIDKFLALLKELQHDIPTH
jgi:thioredoxin-like negative regulator of GroEL